MHPAYSEVQKRMLHCVYDRHVEGVITWLVGNKIFGVLDRLFCTGLYQPVHSTSARPWVIRIYRRYEDEPSFCLTVFSAQKDQIAVENKLSLLSVKLYFMNLG